MTRFGRTITQPLFVTNQPTNQSNQPAKQATNQPTTNQPTNQPTHCPAHQPTCLPIHPPTSTNRFVLPPTKHPFLPPPCPRTRRTEDLDAEEIGGPLAWLEPEDLSEVTHYQANGSKLTQAHSWRGVCMDREGPKQNPWLIRE